MTNRPDGLFEVECPHCDCRLTIDPRARRISHSVKGTEEGKTKSFEDAVGDAVSAPDRAQEKSEKELAKEDGRENKLDQLFDEGLKKAEDDPNKKPPSIFDFD
ncbi:MAG: hypothetical protein GWP38_08090 [Planctomycetia bacterium]|nr:hypothetical protein [Planctomycetia bacterium]